MIYDVHMVYNKVCTLNKDELITALVRGHEMS